MSGFFVLFCFARFLIKSGIFAWETDSSSASHLFLVGTEKAQGICFQFLICQESEEAMNTMMIQVQHLGGPNYWLQEGYVSPYCSRDHYVCLCLHHKEGVYCPGKEEAELIILNWLLLWFCCIFFLFLSFVNVDVNIESIISSSRISSHWEGSVGG